MPKSAPAQPAFRAFWSDAFHAGYKSTAQIDDMVSRAVQGNYNAIVAEVLAYHDNVGGGHGAYWNSAIVPKAADISGGIDPLGYLVQQAHAQGIQVHAWLLAYRSCTIWPPSGNPTLAAHPEWLMVPQASMGGGPAQVGGAYILDPGSPDVQEYAVAIVRELVTNYEIDGIHWDYIRYTQTDAGYPADTSYTRSSLARFQQITGFPGTPSTSEPSWNDFRRRTISELIRRVRAEIPSITSNPRQPLRHTAALIPWGDAPANFTSSSAYGLFQDWRLWMEQGWLDAGCPMLYYREHNATHAQWYRNWVNACLGWRYNRHMYLGQAVYLNSMANSITQMQYAYGQGADGSVNYSYYATADNNLDGNWENDWTWYPYVAANLFTSPTTIPTMPWRNPSTATEGTLWGRVTDLATGLPIDDATVQVGVLASVQTDGNGYYVRTLAPAAPAGTSYSITVTKNGYPPASDPAAIVMPGDVRTYDFALGDDPSCTSDAQCDDGLFCNGAERCVDQACVAGIDPCPGQSCDEAGDFCFTPVCDDDGSCESGEDCNNCPGDCPSSSGASCGNGVCEAGNGENCLTCPQDCNGKQEGKPSGRFCCGDGGGQGAVGCADGRCNSGGFTCTSAPAEPSCCGDAVCGGAEDSFNCPLDCGAPPVCGDSMCDVGEDSCSCPSDCGTAPAVETLCSDGADDDCDSLIDCADADCTGTPSCPACAPQGASCASNADCCSNKCRGNSAGRTCR